MFFLLKLMKKVRQTTFHDPIEGTRGNCMRAVIASLLEKDIKDVPPLDPDPMQMLKVVEYLETQNYEYVGAFGIDRELPPYEAEAKVLELLASKEPSFEGKYYIVYGGSPRGVSHVVVYDKKGLVHDPHFSNGGVKPHGVLLFKEVEHKASFNPFD